MIPDDRTLFGEVCRKFVQRLHYASPSRIGNVVLVLVNISYPKHTRTDELHGNVS